MAQVFNENFLFGGMPPIKVVKNEDSWIITETFQNPYYNPNPEPCFDSTSNVPSVTVEIYIDLSAYRENRMLEVNMTYKNFCRKSRDPYDLLHGYPFDDLVCWRSDGGNGETFSSWRGRVESNGCLRPTERELYGGKTSAEIRRAMEKMDMKIEMYYGYKK